jgi:hypothetical protein
MEILALDVLVSAEKSTSTCEGIRFDISGSPKGSLRIVMEPHFGTDVTDARRSGQCRDHFQIF